MLKKIISSKYFNWFKLLISVTPIAYEAFFIDKDRNIPFLAVLQFTDALAEEFCLGKATLHSYKGPWRGTGFTAEIKELLV